MAAYQFIRNQYQSAKLPVLEAEHWREQVLSVILLIILVLGVVAAIPSIALAAKEGLWSIVVVDLLALSWVAIIWRLPFLKFQHRAFNFLLFVYALGLWFLVKVGYTGMIYLLVFPVMTALLLNLRLALYAVVMAGLSLFTVALLFESNLQIPGMEHYPVWRLAVVAINFTFIAAILAIACGVLLQRLDQSLEHQRVITRSLKDGQASLAHANQELRLIVMAVARLNEMVMILQRDPHLQGIEQYKMVFVNDAFSHISGFSASEVIGKSPDVLFDSLLSRSDFEHLKTALQRSTTTQFELTCYSRTGCQFFLEVDLVPFVDERGSYTHWVATGRDISARKSAEEHIHRLAYFDVLSGLPNRRLLMDRLNSLFNVSRRTHSVAALLFLDLDHFKHVNDAKGHQTGDAILRQVAQRLCKGVREADTVGHLGGDEFVVLLANVGSELGHAAHAALTVAEKIKYTLAQTMEVEGLTYNLTCSIGISLLPRENQEAGDVLREAETALHKAKNQGRNQIAFFENSMQTEIEHRLLTERELMQALAEGSLQAYVQSQVNKHEQTIGGEILLRWQHPLRGFISPAFFIPVAEESGLILKLGDWVMREACLALLKLAAYNDSLPISVNVSPKQFRQADFVEKVEALLQETGAPGERLIFEVTEGLLIENWQDTVARMKELNQLGIRFSIDDFGTGYSSLAYLRKLPLYELKIDKSFVQDMMVEASGRAIVQSILSMAQHLGLQVVAEGVETREQADFLIDHGCHSMQGFYFARPMPLDHWVILQEQGYSDEVCLLNTG